MPIKRNKVGLCEARRRFEQTEQLMRLSAVGRRKRSGAATAKTNAIKRLYKGVKHGD